MSLLSICIPTYNRQRYLAELLDGLLPQVEALPSGCVEVCVSDNVSTDGTRALLEGRLSPALRFWTNETNIGGDRNFLKCVQEARGDYVWLLGDDELVPSGAIARIIAFLSQHRPGLVISTSGNSEPSAGEIFDTYRAAVVNRPLDFPLVHTLISANIFKRTRFDLDFATKHLYLSYAHMFGMMRHLAGERVGTLPDFVAIRPVRAAFAHYPNCLCVKQAIYLFWLIRNFDLPFRYRFFALRKALNLPLEYASRLKNWLIGRKNAI